MCLWFALECVYGATDVVVTWISVSASFCYGLVDHSNLLSRPRVTVVWNYDAQFVKWMCCSRSALVGLGTSLYQESFSSYEAPQTERFSLCDIDYFRNQAKGIARGCGFLEAKDFTLLGNGTMGHRHLPNTFQPYDQEQNHINRATEGSFVNIGRSVPPESTFVYPRENMSTVALPHPSGWNFNGRPYDYSSSNFTTGAPHFQSGVSVPSHESFPHSSAAGSSYLPFESSSGHTYSNYPNRHTFHEAQGSSLDPAVENRRWGLKRKSPGDPIVFESGGTSRFYGTQNSLPPLESQSEKPAPLYQPSPLAPDGFPCYRAQSLSIGREESLRNVRSRSRFDLNNPIRANFSSSHDHHPTIHPTSYSGSLDHTNANEISDHWNHTLVAHPAHARTVAPDINAFRNDASHFLFGSNAADTLMNRHASTSSSNSISTSLYIHGQPEAGRDGQTNYIQRTFPSYRAGPSNFPPGHESTISQNSFQLLSESYPPRYTRPSYAGGWHNCHLNGRSWVAAERAPAILNGIHSHERFGLEASVIADRPSFYASRNVFDQYRDMRLDIDNMSYEELLALGERLGNVSTGLSEDMIIRCLTEKVYTDQQQEEESCAICLEEYKKNEAVGILKNCGHNYHVGCIKQWLLLKNVCPICKASALSDSP
ncbi:Zinc finger, RING-type [Dillenia turbinata]|uniref:RING-type E3 ubiquitin transferase n=1 Tax=Dillenia turbinata TaxID=194707 RepID=A0AAN8VKE9_9MAGN